MYIDELVNIVATNCIFLYKRIAQLLVPSVADNSYRQAQDRIGFAYNILL